MSFKMVFRSLREVFPQVDLRILKAVAMEHSKDVDAAVEFVLYEVLPSLNESTERPYNIDDTDGRKNSPAEFGVQDNFWGNQGSEEENTNLLPRLEGNGASLHPNVQGIYGTEATVNVTEVCTPAQNFPSSEEDTNFLIQCEEPVSRGLSKGDDIYAFSNLKTNNSHSDAVASAQDMPSSVSGDTLNLECGVDKVNQSSLSVFDEQFSRGISENCCELVAPETDISSVTEKPTLVGTQSGDVVGMGFLEDFLSDVKSNKETLVIAFESVNNMIKDMELNEDRAKQAREEASKAGHEILTKAEDMKQMFIHAKEAKERQEAEVDAEKSLLATKAQELQSRILNLSDQRERSISIIEEKMSENDYSNYNDAAPSMADKKKRKSGGRNQRWTEPASIFLLHFMAGMVRDGVTGDLNQIAAMEINQKFGMAVTEKHVYNQLRTWKTKWSRICTLKTLSGCVVWKSEIRTIEMPIELYTEYIKVHQKDKPYLNQPIEHYDELYILFGGDRAKGRYAMDDGPSFTSPTQTDIRGGSFNTASPPEATPSSDLPASMSVSQRSSSKGKRKDVELEIMGSFADSFKKFAHTIYDKREEDKKVVAQCYEQLRLMVGTEYQYYIFNEDEVSAAYDYFVKNPDLGAAFLSRRTDAEKAAWLYRFTRKNLD